MRKEVAALAMMAAERIVEREIQNVGQDEIVDEVINKQEGVQDGKINS